MRGMSLDGPRLDMGLFCTVRNLFWTEIRPCVFSCMLLLGMNSMYQLFVKNEIVNAC